MTDEASKEIFAYVSEGGKNISKTYKDIPT